jgi:hypothetical protein
VIKTIIEKFKKYKEKRFFTKHGVENWDQFNRKYDSDIDKYASKIKNIYFGYKTVVIVLNSIEVHDMFGPTTTSRHVAEWCKENIESKYRIDCFPVTNDVDGDLIAAEWVYPEKVIIAFKNEKDAMNFIITYNGPETNNGGSYDVVKIDRNTCRISF